MTSPNPVCNPGRARRWLATLAALALAGILGSCGGGGGGGDSNGGNPPPDPITPPTATRGFMMGTTLFHAGLVNGELVIPDWKFENPGDRDLVSLQVDDFWGVPWGHCSNNGCAGLPPAWAAQWARLAADAQATGKPLYLALSPLTDRRALARRVQADGSLADYWTTQEDAVGCYLFASDPDAARHKASYIGYVRYLVDLVKPRYLSPAIEVNVPFSACPSQKAAWMAWYADVHNALKAAYPDLVIFPTFQLEHLYGVAAEATRCAGGSFTPCFDQRLAEVLTLPADRIALSSYPMAWSQQAEFDHAPPTDTLARIRQATPRRIWMAETGWTAQSVRASYAHGTAGTCGPVALPATLDVAGRGTLNVANDAGQAAYMSSLLEAAQAQGVEAVVWWLNRDFLDGDVAATCPCTPASSATCVMAEAFHAAAGDAGESMLREFGSMGLRRNDGSARPGQAVWQNWLGRAYKP